MIYIHLKALPPSANTAYFNHPSGGRALTKAGKKYKSDVTQHIIRHHAAETKELKKNCAIGVLIAYGFSNLFTKSFPEKAKNRFTQQDVSNRAKLLHDAIVDATSIDDSQFCFDFAYKYQAPAPETRIYIWNEDEKNVGARLLSAFAELIGSGRTLQPNRAGTTL